MSDVNEYDFDVVDIPDQQIDWESKYKNEVDDRVKEREKYKPISQTFSRMHPDDVRAVSDFASAFSNGDNETAIKWMIDNAKTLAGDRFSTYLSPELAQEAVVDAIKEGTESGLTENQVTQLVESRLQEYQHAAIVNQYEVEIENILIENGYDPETPLATAVIVAASKRPDLSLRDAIIEMEEDLLRKARGIGEKRRAAAETMGQPSPQGSPGINKATQNMSARERALARLEANGL